MKNSKTIHSSSQIFLRRVLIFLTLLLTIVIIPLYAYKVFTKTDYSDFSVYYKAALRTYTGEWDQLYNLADQASPLRYMPLFLPFLEPLALFERQTSAVLWYGFQCFCFGLGFYFLGLSLRSFLFTPKAKPKAKPRVQTVLCCTFLFALRLILDTFTSGQISGLMFLGFTLGFYGWMHRSSSLAAIALVLPSLLKIGPAVTYGVFLSSRWKQKKQAIQMTSLSIGALFAFTEIWGILTTGSVKKIHQLWANWSMIVANDSVYYDSSHYGSQSINSVLLRLARAGWITAEQSQTFYLSSAALICLGILCFWMLRAPKNMEGRATFFCLGIYPYLWLMPETFKYTLLFLILPVSLLIARVIQTPRLFPIFSLGFSTLTVSFASKDLLDLVGGDSLFFNLQKFSFPWMASMLLGLASLHQAWDESRWSQSAQFLKHLFSPRPHLGPWDHLPASDRSLEWTLLLPLPLDSTTSLHETILQDLQALTEKWKHNTYEVLVLPYSPFGLYGNRVSLQHPMIRALQNLAPKVQILFQSPQGRGAALQYGFLKSCGKHILIGNLEQPLGVEFYSAALQKLEEGFDLVRGNRRLIGSHFQIPIPLLPLVYKRHWMGTQFNCLIRRIFPISTTDTHSGHFGISWSLAQQSFATQSSTDFLSDLELSLTAHAQQYKEIDIPVRVLLESEKSWPRILRETLGISLELPNLALRYFRGAYDKMPICSAISADDWGLSLGVNQGILKLAEQEVVRRVSLMANAEHLTDHLSSLLRIKNIQLGIHFNLTYGKSLHDPEQRLSSTAGRKLLSWIIFRQRNILEVCKELEAQLARLSEVGVQIQYLDGHHHMHLLPGLLPHIIPILKKYGIQQIRLPYDPRLWFTAQAPIALLSLLAEKTLRDSGLKILPFIYPQAQHFNDPGRLRALMRTNPDAEIIVHPALWNDLQTLQEPEPYQEGRIQEFKALQMLAQVQIQ